MGGETGHTHSLTLAFYSPSVTRHKNTALTCISRGRCVVFFPLEAAAPSHDVAARCSLLPPRRFLSSGPTPARQAALRAAVCQGRLIMAQVSRYRAATISSVLLREFTQRQQVAEYTEGGVTWLVLFKHLSQCGESASVLYIYSGKLIKHIHMNT